MCYNMNRYNIAIRSSEILEAYQKETPVARIARRHNLSVRRIYAILKWFEDLYAQKRDDIAR